MSWRATVITLYPEMFPGPLGQSLAGRAMEQGIWSLEARQMREHGLGRHRAVDDTPFGGGAGMVLRADVVDAALNDCVDERPVVVLTPRGAPLDQQSVRREGIDQRVIEARNLTEISIGDYILSGGETAALVLLDACVRLLPGVMGAMESAEEESFSHGLLEYPHYTRPAEWNGRAVPDILLSGNHAAIAAWRLAQSKAITRARRPDLWAAHVAGHPTTQV